eukprot:403345746
MQQDQFDINHSEQRDKSDNSNDLSMNQLMSQVPKVQFVDDEDLSSDRNLPKPVTYNFEDFMEDQQENKSGLQMAQSLDQNFQDKEGDELDEDEEQEFIENLIIHNAKKNLCFELEYIQTVFQSLHIRVSTKFDLFRMQLKEEGSVLQGRRVEDHKLFTAASEEHKSSNRGQINFVDSDRSKDKHMKTYLENIYNVLSQMKRDFLKTENTQHTRKSIRKALKAMACHLERTRFYLDGYIYPRDVSLNLIDVKIEASQQERKKEMHLTERLYSIVYKDFFTAYEKCVDLGHKIKLMEGHDVEKVNQKIQNESRLSVALQNDLENLTEESSFIETQTIVSENKTTRDVDEVRKNFIRNTLGSKKEGMLKILKNFSPTLASGVNFDMDEVLDKEFALIFSIKNINISNHELFFTIYSDNNQPCSLTAQLDTSRILTWTHEEFNIHKVYKGYTILPLSKLFWAQQLRHKQVFEIKEAMFYKQSNSFKIEEKYSTLIDKRGFKKYRDPNLAKYINLCYSYRMESKIDELQIQKSSSILVNRINFDQRDFSQKGKDQIRMYKSKDKYRFNDIKVDLKSIAFFDCNQKKSPIFRIQVALRDNYGVVYDTIYKSMCDNQFEFTQTYESLIYQNQDDIAMHESFFVRIPTKSLDTLKKLYLIFLVQTLVNNKDSKGGKIKSSNYTNELDRLQFKTEIFGVLPLYDGLNNSILKNDVYHLAMWQFDEPMFREFVKFDHCKHFKITDDKLAVQIKIISNEFTHNRYINSLMLLQEKTNNSSDYERVITELKSSDPDELIIYHDKILDKLFQIMNQTKSIKIQDIVFETIIEIIQLFQIQYKDYKEYLNLYIEKHFAHSKVYIPLLHQIRQTSEIIKEGFRTDNEIENQNVILASIKYLSVVLKLMKISFHEELSCQDSLPHTAEPKYDRYDVIGELEPMQEATKANTMIEQNQYYQKSFMQLDLYKRMKKSMIEEDDEDDESSGEENQNNAGALQYLNQQYDYERTASKLSLMRKKAIRNTIQHEGLLNKVELSKREFGVYVQKSMISIFEGCHKDAMKSTLSIRAILYEVKYFLLFVKHYQQNITEIFDQIIEFMDDKFLSQILMFLYEEQSYQFKVSRIGITNQRNQRSIQQNSRIPQQQEQMHGSVSQKTGGSSHQAVSTPGGQRRMLSRASELIEDYVSNKNFMTGLQDLSFINEEYISKLKIIAMGKILANGLLDQVQGNSNRIVKAFCENIQQHHLKREEMSIHVFYFLYQLFVYLKEGDDYTLSNTKTKHQSQKLKIFSKQMLDLKDFFTKILPQLVEYLGQLYKQPNVNYKLKESKDLEDILVPFKEKSALVLLSVANAISKEKLKEFIFPEHKKLTTLMVNLKKLTKKMSFQEPYNIFFEKKKIQVIRKVNEYVISIFMAMNIEDVTQEYHMVINQCRIIEIYLWCKLATIKMDYKKTTRSKTLVKDQMKAHKGKMLEIFRKFWEKFKSIGQPWITLRYLNKVMTSFLKLGQSRAIKIYMEIISDTIQLEYKNTEDIFHTSNNIFQVFNDLNLQNGKEDFCKQFYESFKEKVKKTELFDNEPKFEKLVELRIDQMEKLSEALQNVNYSNSYMQQNTFYRVFCQAKLMEVFWELKLFRLFNENQESFKRLHEKLKNFAEMAFTDLRFLQIIQQSDEDIIQIGQREINALIQIDLMKSIKDNLKKAELYEKAIEIFNQMKDLFENVIFDYDSKEQALIYQEMSVNQNRHYACYFKVGFFGQSFPGMLKNQEFIYRGGKLVRRIDIIDKLREHFPDVISVNDQQVPSKDIQEGAQKYLQITPVFALTFKEMQQFGMTSDKEELALGQKVKALPEKLRNYYVQNFKRRFFRETVIASKHTDELQKDIQIEIFKVKDKFPTIINMQNIIRTKKIIQKGIDKAIRDVKDHIERIENSKKAVQNQITQEDCEIDGLQSLVRSTLESPIQGGIQRYLNAFLNESYLHSPQDKPKVLVLFKMMEDCSAVINDAVQLLQQKSQNEIMQTKMNGDYLKFKEQLADIRSYIDQSAQLPRF